MVTNSLRNKKVIVTCGPTWVAIDPVRVISNRSTGEMGHRIAAELVKAGAKVTLLEGPVTAGTKPPSVTIKKFHFFDELLGSIKNDLKKFDVLVHAAAVSDYRLARPFTDKISSTQAGLKLKLVPTPKIINLIKKINPRIFLVGFKLSDSVTPNAAKTRTRDLFRIAGCDLVIANKTTGKKYSGYIVGPNKDILAAAANRKQMAQKLIKVMEGRI